MAIMKWTEFAGQMFSQVWGPWNGVDIREPLGLQRQGGEPPRAEVASGKAFPVFTAPGCLQGGGESPAQELVGNADSQPPAQIS